MRFEGYFGDRFRSGQEGWGWSGVTPQQKNRAAGRLVPSGSAEVRALYAGLNAQRVWRREGSGYWTGGKR